MIKDEALKLALEALQNPWKAGPDGVADAIIAIKEALAQPEHIQVSPLEFVEMVTEKEHLIGNPIFWAEWPNKEKK
jgi:hypothetical protein